MDQLRVISRPPKLNAGVHLPASKSISNRVLIIRALTQTPFVIQNLSEADDTVLLETLFKSTEQEMYVRNAGTVARFLLAYYASRNSDVILKGSERMNERPIGELVKALQNLGADIEYLHHSDKFPVHIKGKTLNGGTLSMHATASSQFASALLLIAPTLKEGLSLELVGEVVSEPYIMLTLNTMANFGIDYLKQGNRISVPAQKYVPKTFTVESDWSSASYFYAIAALFPGSELRFENLYSNSYQGDSILKEIMVPFGVDTKFAGNTSTIKSKMASIDRFEYDFINYPDLIPTFVCLCCTLNIPFSISGTRTLKHKESDRAEVLKTELAKLGYIIECDENTTIYRGTLNPVGTKKKLLNTYQDHRIAMAFAILASKNPDICIENPKVVDKSFPSFWEALKNIGFELIIT